MNSENEKFNRVDDDRTPRDRDSNPDPVTGEPGSHPVGTGVGAAAVGTAATAFGAAVGGPVGAAVGAVAGSVIGGLAGKGIAEKIDPTVEDNYWRQNYATRPYATSNRTYEEYQPAYRTGYEGYGRYYDGTRSYDDVEADLRRDYETHHSGSDNRLGWDDAKHAVRDAWNRVDETVKRDRR